MNGNELKKVIKIWKYGTESGLKIENVDMPAETTSFGLDNLSKSYPTLVSFVDEKNQVELFYDLLRTEKYLVARNSQAGGFRVVFDNTIEAKDIVIWVRDDKEYEAEIKHFNKA